MTDGGGTYPNLFSPHPPFQIDGNFGGTAGIAEMLVQSHSGFIQFLPALPPQWKDGNYEGLRVRGGGVTGAKWKNHVLQQASLQADIAHTFKVKIPENARGVRVKTNKSNRKKKGQGGIVEVALEKDQKAILTFIY